MDIDNLFTHIKKGNQTDTKKYLAIEIGLHSIKSAAWEVVGTKPQLLTTGTIEEYTTDDPETLLHAVDASLTKALTEIQPEPDEVIFSFPETWVEKSSISSEKKPLVKTLIQKLGLKPVGFVVTIEAIIQYLKLKQGSPFSGILIGTSDEDVQITIVKNGQISGSHLVGRSNDLGSDVEEGIARFDQINNLPSSMILYDGHTDLESHKQDLMSYDWQERLPFLHLPKITTFTPDETIKAVVLAGGAEVVKTLQVTKDGKTTTPVTPPPDTSTVEKLPDLASEFGFSSDPDSPSFPESDNLVPVASDTLKNSVEPDSFTDVDTAETLEDFDVSSDSDAPLISSRPPLRSLLNRFSYPRIRFFSSHRSPWFAIAILALLFLLAVSGTIAAYWFLPTAQVTIFLEPKPVTSDLNFILDTEITTADIGAATIPARLAIAESEGSLTLPVTGSKTIGERASGTITIYNRTDSTKTLPEGTQLIGPGSLIYTLNEDITIASASSRENADFSVTIEPRTAETQITAAAIGAQYNLGSGTEFSVGNFSTSSFVARASSDIIGGSSQQVTAVAKEDLTTLSEQLQQKLEVEATKNFNQDNDFTAALFLPEDQEFTTSPSTEVGEVADSLTVTGTFKATAATYKKTDLSLLIEKQVQENYDQYEFIQEQSNLDVTNFTRINGTTFRVTGKAQAKLIPTLDTTEITQKISGHFPKISEPYLLGLNNVKRTAIEIKPKWFPQPLKTLPHIEERIHITFEVIQ